MSVLYIVATPIGNLEDISLRAIRVLREVNLIAAEDTRKTRRLLARYDIGTPMTSYYEHSKRSKLEYILERLKQEDIALVSEAGMPGLSDPGYELVTAASERGIRVVPIPGPSAVITALVVSGLPTDRFSYLGFLPHKTAARKRLLESAAGEPGSIVVLETPHRLRAALEDIRLVLGDRRIAVCRELTKRFEEVYRGTVSQASEHFRTPRGEFTLVIEGKRAPKQPPMTAEIEEQLHYQYLSGATAKEAIARIAGETGLPRKELYRTWLKLGRVWEINKDSYHSLERRE
ncbi:MAG: 16S rRNA (cytidine(1402)-2'-O)-methyltransferase [Chloroflexi bacterium]|nr:16S rRNA (cytidine(1402)-2'-O)-methyltransferase [Chloroflexota bacterium]